MKNPVVLAPMAGITGRIFRDICREYGCALAYTEMISARALTYNNGRTRAMVDIGGEKGPVSVQLFGSEPETMAEAAALVEEAGADIVDINMGCPVPKVVKNNEGCALMRDLALSARIISSVVRRIKIPVTVKIRKGWDDSSINAVEFARMAEANGVSAVAVHGRTRGQFYNGAADWEIIGRVCENISVPVIGNGDIWQPEDARRMMDQTGCSMVMIGRGALGNPWLLSRTVKYLQDGILEAPPNPCEKIDLALRHLHMVIARRGEVAGVKEMRKHIAWYIKGLRDAARVREQVNKLVAKEEVERMLLKYREITACD